MAKVERIGWVDVAKGICIILVVMMHSTLGVEAAAGETGWLNPALTFAKPFRMPDFFLVAGLFVGFRLRAPLWLYVDRKVLHFAYFYVLWLAIQFGLKAPGMVAEFGAAETLRLFLVSFVEPFGTLWFIYHLALFLVTARLVRDLPRIAVIAFAALLHLAPIHTGLTLVDAYADYLVFFLAGVFFAPAVFALADWARLRPALALGGLAVWAVVNGVVAASGLLDWSLVTLVAGFVGALAIIALATLITDRLPGRILAYVGSRSITVYLAFFLPMAITRTVLLKFAPELSIGTVSAIVTVVAVVAPLLLGAAIDRTGIGRFLFERPRWARLKGPVPLTHPLRTRADAPAGLGPDLGAAPSIGLAGATVAFRDASEGSSR